MSNTLHHQVAHAGNITAPFLPTWLQITQKVQAASDSLDIGTLITDNFLGHLEASWAQLGCPHFLPAIAFPLARCLSCYRFVSSNLQTKSEQSNHCNQTTAHNSNGTRRKTSHLVFNPSLSQRIIYYNDIHYISDFEQKHTNSGTLSIVICGCHHENLCIQKRTKEGLIFLWTDLQKAEAMQDTVLAIWKSSVCNWRK